MNIKLLFNAGGAESAETIKEKLKINRKSVKNAKKNIVENLIILASKAFDKILPIYNAQSSNFLLPTSLCGLCGLCGE